MLDLVLLWVALFGFWPWADPGHHADTLASSLDIVLHIVAAVWLARRCWKSLRRIGVTLLHLYRTAYVHAARSTMKPEPESWHPGAPVTWPTDSGDPVQNRNLPTDPHKVAGDPVGSDGSTATLVPAVRTGESSGFIVDRAAFDERTQS